MSEYRRFFSYIYAYEQRQKTSNRGFAKIEMKGTNTTIELHMRSAALSVPSVCLYLFVRKDDEILGFPLGDVPFSGGNADRRFTLNQPKLGESGYTVSDVAGILLADNDGICFVSQWDEATIDWESFRVYKPEEKPVPEQTTNPLAEKVIQSAELPLPQRKAPIFTAIPTPSALMQPDDPPSDRPDPQENPMEQPVRDESFSPHTSPHTSKPHSWQETWQQLTDSLPLMQPFSNQEIQCVRVALKDLRLLPPSNWHLCNNSFLLHGFFTYRHLVFGEIPSAKEHKWFIGVPGIRYRQEHVLAAIFGFSDFLPDKNSSDTDAPFGYWYVTMTGAD